MLQPQATTRSGCFQVWTEAVIHISKNHLPWKANPAWSSSLFQGCGQKCALDDRSSSKFGLPVTESIFWVEETGEIFEIFPTPFPENQQLRGFLSYGRAAISTALLEGAAQCSPSLGTYLACRWRYFLPLTRAPAKIFIHALLTEKLTTY